MAKETKQDKLNRARIARIYKEVGHGIQINMLSIPEVYKVGEAAIAAGDSDEQIADKMRAHLQKIRTN